MLHWLAFAIHREPSMRIISLNEAKQIAAASLTIAGKTVDIPNDFDIPAHEFVIIEETFQKVINGEINFYQGATSLKEKHICKYDISHYFNKLASLAGK